MIQLHQFAPAMGLPNASPFCMKVETYLRLAGLPFETVVQVNPTKAPLGKLPYVREGDAVVSDSSTIVHHLKARHGDQLDAALSPRQHAQGLLLQRLLEEHLYWVMVYTRWHEDAGWAVTRPAFFGALPLPLRWLLPPLARRGMRAELRGQGLGRMPRAEILARGQADVVAVAALLGDQPFLLGDQPSSYDASGHAFLANLLWAPIDTPLQRQARSLPALEAYCQRVRARAWG